MDSPTAFGSGTCSDGLFTCHLRIGQVSCEVEGASSKETYVSDQLAAFRGDCVPPDIDVNVHWTDRLRCSSAEKIFDSGGVWSVSKSNSDLVFDFVSPLLGNSPYKRIVADREFRDAELMLSREAFAGRETVSPLEYPADELLFTNYLAHHALGAEVHGCGLIDPEYGGFLFLGHSGAGKSTTTRLWNSVRNPKILSDDRIILRIHDGELWMYGTPWHGEAAFASPAKARINKVFVLQHGEANTIAELSPARAVGEFFARCFPPFHSALGLSNTLEFLHRVVNLVPCYEFNFLPNASAVEAAIAFRG
jgi:hypothetical protein